MAQAQIDLLVTAIATYKLDTGTYPTTAQGLEALVSRPPGVVKWQGSYIDPQIPVDPWGRPYVYLYPREPGNRPELLSYGADGRLGGTGDSADIRGWNK